AMRGLALTVLQMEPYSSWVQVASHLVAALASSLRFSTQLVPSPPSSKTLPGSHTDLADVLPGMTAPLSVAPDGRRVRLVAGRESLTLARFGNEFSATPSRFSEAAREHYAELYALPAAMHSGFMQFAAFDQDALDNQSFLSIGKLGMPILAVGGEKS